MTSTATAEEIKSNDTNALKEELPNKSSSDPRDYKIITLSNDLECSLHPFLKNIETRLNINNSLKIMVAQVMHLQECMIHAFNLMLCLIMLRLPIGM